MPLRRPPCFPSPRVLVPWAWLWVVVTASAQVQNSEGSAPVLAVPPTLPEIRLPDMRDIQIAVPRPVRAAQAALGMGKQRLALVLGLGTVGRRSVVDSAPRNAQAVAAALRSGGFVVMLREDLTAAELRGSLKEFRDRLQPGSVGFVYVTGLGAQVQGKNLLLPRDAALDATGPALAQRLRDTAVPLDEVSDALIGTPDSLRLLVVDAAWHHPALAALPQAGLAQPRLPHGLMALFSHALDSVQEVPAVAPLPLPPPTDAVEIAATPFVRTLVGALLKPRTNGPEVLRSTRRSIADATLGQNSPWLGGDTDDKEELAEATLLDGLVPRTPEEIAREALRQGSRALTRPAVRAAGEQTVAEVLAQSSATPVAGPAAAAPAPAALAAEPAPARGPEVPGSSLGSTVGSAVSALGTAASVAATVAGTAAAVQVAQTAATVSAASTAVGVAGSAASALGSTAVALAARAGSSSSSGSAAAAATSSAAVVAPAAVALAPVGPVPAVTPAPPVAPVALPPGALATAAAAATPVSSDTPGLAPAAPVADPARRIAPAATAATEALPRAQRPVEGAQAAAPSAVRAVPRRNAFGYTEGDRFSYQVVDTWADEVVGEYTTAIEEVLADGQLRANGQQLQMDPQGRPTRLARPDGGYSIFEPYQDLWWSKPQRGDRRAVKFVEKFQRGDQMRGETEWRGRSRVAQATEIKTPAGTFEVLPIESSGTWSETLANGARSTGRWSRTVYYSLQLQHPVAIDVRDLDSLDRLLRHERIELLHAQQARATP